MGKEPDNLVLTMLRDIRAKQDEHSESLEAHGRSLERLDRDFQELRHSMIYSLGMATSGHLKNQERDGRLEEQKKMDRLFDRVEDLLGRS